MAVAVRPEANPFVQFLEQYGNDRVAFVREVLGGNPDADQTAYLQARDRGDRQIAERSGHNVGKTTQLAWDITHHAVCKFPQKTVCTSATAPQLHDALVPETKAWFKKLPPALLDLFEMKAESIHLKAAPEESFVSFRTSRPETPEALAGVHSENVLLICDEASGIPDTVFDAAAGSMAGEHCHIVMTGNPLRNTGLFADVWHRPEIGKTWTKFHVSCVGHPRISQAWIDEQRAKYGGEEDNRFRVRVLGEFPRADDDTIIPFDLVQAALDRDVIPNPGAPVIWGLDCARGGGDPSALAKRKGNVLLEPTQIRAGRDLMQLAGWVKRQWDDCDPQYRPREINIDVIGLGGGVVDRLNELGLPVRGINVAEDATIWPERYHKLRTELWFKGEEWFRRKDCNIAGDDDLLGELVKQRFRFYDSNGKLYALSKQEMRPEPSPNRADAFLLTLASDHITLAFGSASNPGRNQPLKRAILGIV